MRGVLSLYGVMFPRKRDKRDKRDIGCSAGDLSVTVGVTKSKKRDTTKKRDKRDKPCGAREVSVTVDLSRQEVDGDEGAAHGAHFFKPYWASCDGTIDSA